MKKQKRLKYFSILLYWSEETVKRGLDFMIPIELSMETLNLLKDTSELVDSEIYNVELSKKSKVINEYECDKLLQKLNIIRTYLKNRENYINQSRKRNDEIINV